MYIFWWENTIHLKFGTCFILRAHLKLSWIWPFGSPFYLAAECLWLCPIILGGRYFFTFCHSGYSKLILYLPHLSSYYQVVRGSDSSRQHLFQLRFSCVVVRCQVALRNRCVFEPDILAIWWTVWRINWREDTTEGKMVSQEIFTLIEMSSDR